MWPLSCIQNCNCTFVFFRGYLWISSQNTLPKSESGLKETVLKFSMVSWGLIMQSVLLITATTASGLNTNTEMVAGFSLVTIHSLELVCLDHVSNSRHLQYIKFLLCYCRCLNLLMCCLINNL